MFAIIQDNKVTGFITDEEQKAFLVENVAGVSFAEFEWDISNPNNYLYPEDVIVNDDGTVTVQKGQQ